ncbi:MAG: hypothetical protein VKJ02_14500 [Snowella sp.]|nr:hypothetical protein [Snowella sp.]
MEIPLKQLPQQFQEVITELQHTHKTLIITDEGKPLATIAPIAQSKRAPFGCLKDSLQILDDIVAPAVPESEWEVFQ